MTKRNLTALLALLLVFPSWALTVSHLRTQTLPNPVGLDATPQFSWKLQSSDFGVMQKAYRVVLSSDAEGKHIVWDSKWTPSEASTFVALPSVVKLQPATRYYWRVTVKDNKGKKATSTEPAYFETGLLQSGWDKAIWIKATDKPLLDNQASKAQVARYELTADMTIAQTAAGFVLGYTDPQHYLMWQIKAEDAKSDTPLLRRHIYNGSTQPETADVPLTGFTKADLLNQTLPVAIEVSPEAVITFIGGKQVDKYVPADHKYWYGKVGFYAYNGGGQDERAYFDNVMVFDRSGAHPVILYYETFEKESPSYFTEAEVRNFNHKRMAYMHANNGQTIVLDKPQGRVPQFRKEFVTTKTLQKATLFTSALGVYDLFVNGQRVGHLQADGSTIYEEMKPGWTDYEKRVFYSTHDVTHLLRYGSNVVGAEVSSGWWAGHIQRGTYGNPSLGFRAKLLLQYTDGSSEVVVTDKTWTCSFSSAMRAADIYDGEVYDARNESAWSEPGRDKSEQFAVEENTDFKGEIVAFNGPFVQTLDDLRFSPKTASVYEGTQSTGTTFGKINSVQTITGNAPLHLKKGQAVIFDFGQNLVGWVDFKVKGDAGTQLHLHFTEMLNDDGDARRGNDGPGGSLYLRNLRSAKAKLDYTLAGRTEGEGFHSSHSFYGFRYCEVRPDADVDLLTISAVPISSSHDDGGVIRTSNVLVNQLYSNILWGQRGNLLSIPTDCPQRDERLGWTADTQVFTRTANYNGNTAAFYHKWMTDMRDSQHPAGAYPDVAPRSSVVGYGGAAWSDAGVLVPWTIYQMYGDTDILRENFESMEHYMKWISEQKGDGPYQGPNTVYGDWLSFVPTDYRYIAMAYYAYDAQLMARMARVIGKEERAAYYDELFANIKKEFLRRFYPDGEPKVNTQTALLLALKYNLLKDDAHVQAMTRRLADLITENQETLNTGFVGTAILCPTLSQFGLNDKAYNLLLQRRCPSWLYSIDQGATTMWERWNSYTIESGFGDPAMNSFNHYAYGAIGEWLYRYMVGIEVDEAQPGFKHILLQPTPDLRETIPNGSERIHWAWGSVESPYGTILSNWTLESDGVFSYEATVPCNTTATLRLPVGKDAAAPAAPKGARFVEQRDGHAIYELGSGNYKFSVKLQY